VHPHAPILSLRRQVPLGGAVHKPVERRWSDRHRTQHLNFHVTAPGQRFHLACDEKAEGGLGWGGKQRAKRKDAHRLQSLRTNISATASQAGLSTTTCR
jgi:hypothetical protein